MRLHSYSAKRADRYWQKPLGIFFAQVVKREVCSTRVMSPSDALWALWKAIAMARAGLFQTILFKRWRSFMHGPNVSKYEKTQTHRDSKWNGCGEIWHKKIRLSKSRQIGCVFKDSRCGAAWKLNYVFWVFYMQVLCSCTTYGFCKRFQWNHAFN